MFSLLFLLLAFLASSRSCLHFFVLNVPSMLHRNKRSGSWFSLKSGKYFNNSGISFTNPHTCLFLILDSGTSELQSHLCAIMSIKETLFRLNSKESDQSLILVINNILIYLPTSLTAIVSKNYLFICHMEEDIGTLSRNYDNNTYNLELIFHISFAFYWVFLICLQAQYIYSYVWIVLKI